MSGKKYKTIIIRLSVELELTAEEYYRELARKFPEKARLFTLLADEESIHANEYEEILQNELNPNTTPREIAEKNIEILQKSGLVEKLKSKDHLKHDLPLLGVLGHAIELEKQTELYYYYSLGLFDDIDQKVVQKILFSEHEHRIKLIQLRKELLAEEDTQ